MCRPSTVTASTTTMPSTVTGFGLNMNQPWRKRALWVSVRIMSL